MLTPGHAGPVIHARRVRARVPSRVLDGLEWDAHVQQRRDESVAEAVGMDAIDLVVALADQPGGLGELTEQAVDGLSVEGHARRRVARADTATVLAAEDRALRPRAKVRSTARSVRSLRATSTSFPPLPRTTSE